MTEDTKELAANFVAEMKNSIGLCSIEHAKQHINALNKLGLSSHSLAVIAMVEAAYDAVSAMEEVKCGTNQRTEEVFERVYMLLSELREL